MAALINLTDHQIALLSFVVSFAALLFALASIFVALYAISRSNKNSSAATLVTLNEGFRQAWQRFLEAEDDAGRQYELSELMNLAELACAIHSERSLVGVSRELAGDYLEKSLSLLSDNADARGRIPAMFNSPETFEYIRRFLNSRSNAQLLVSWFPLLGPPAPARSGVTQI